MATDADRLVKAYGRTLLFVQEKPAFVFVKREGKIGTVPALAGLPLRMLLTRHVKRGLGALRRGMSWNRASGEVGPENAKSTLDAIEAFEQSLPTFAVSRRLVFAGIVALVILLQLISTLETQTTLLSELVLSVFGLDPDRAATAIDAAGFWGVLGAVLLVWLVTAVYLLIPAWAMVAKRRVLELDSDKLAGGGFGDPMPTPSERYGGTYKLERETFGAVGVRPRPERQPDLALAGLLFLPLLVTLAILCVAGWATNLEGGIVTSLMFWGGLNLGATLVVATLHQQGRLPARDTRLLRQGVLLSIVGAAALIGLIAKPEADESADAPKPDQQAEVKSVTVVERSATLESVADQTNVSLEKLPNHDAFALFKLTPGLQSDTGDGLVGMVVAFEVESDSLRCSCPVRWILYDTATMAPVGEEQLAPWWGRGWPRATVRLKRRGTATSSSWVPLPRDPGKYFVKIEIAAEGNEEHVVAAADSPRVRLPLRAGAPKAEGKNGPVPGTDP